MRKEIRNYHYQLSFDVSLPTLHYSIYYMQKVVLLWFKHSFSLQYGVIYNLLHTFLVSVYELNISLKCPPCLMSPNYYYYYLHTIFCYYILVILIMSYCDFYHVNLKTWTMQNEAREYRVSKTIFPKEIAITPKQSTQFPKLCLHFLLFVYKELKNLHSSQAHFCITS